MKCPECGSEETQVIDSRAHVLKDGDDSRKRRRACSKCGARFNTFEVYEEPDLDAEKKLEAIRVLTGKVSGAQ